MEQGKDVAGASETLALSSKQVRSYREGRRNLSMKLERFGHNKCPSFFNFNLTYVVFPSTVAVIRSTANKAK